MITTRRSRRGRRIRRVRLENGKQTRDAAYRKYAVRRARCPSRREWRRRNPERRLMPAAFSAERNEGLPPGDVLRSTKRNVSRILYFQSICSF